MGGINHPLPIFIHLCRISYRLYNSYFGNIIPWLPFLKIIANTYLTFWLRSKKKCNVGNPIPHSSTKPFFLGRNYPDNPIWNVLSRKKIVLGTRYYLMSKIAIGQFGYLAIWWFDNVAIYQCNNFLPWSDLELGTLKPSPCPLQLRTENSFRHSNIEPSTLNGHNNPLQGWNLNT